MLRIEDVTLSVAGRRLLEGASASVPAGHKVGIVGPNGTGKTTLFRAIRGELPLEGGAIGLPSGARVGGVAQEAPATGDSLLATVLAADHERASLLAEADTASDPARIAEVQTRLADIDAWSGEARAATILAGLGFDEAAQARPTREYSGGWRMRVALAGVLFARPDVLLLDEPTNYLDLEGALWLEGYLARYPHTVLLISHDRGLLNRAVGHILHFEDRRLHLYAGGYDAFERMRGERRAVQAAEAAKQQQRRAHLQSYVDRFRYKADKAKQAQARIKALERMEIVRAPEEEARTRFAFPEPEEMAPPILRLDEAAVGYDARPVLSRLDLRIDGDDRIALLGRNGEGKSTLSKLLAGAMSPMDGRRVASGKLRIGMFAQHQLDGLRADETPLDHLRRVRPGEMPGKGRARLAGFGLGADQADVPVAKLSGGQKARLSLLLATIDAPHLLILDEPTNHLDIASREALAEALAAYTGAVVLVSHDMHLLSLVADRLWLVQGGRVAAWEGDLDDYRAHLLGRAEPARDAGKDARKRRPEPVRASRERILELRAEVRRCEERVGKIDGIREKLAKKLADPALYEADRVGELEVWNRKYAEAMEGADRAEALWVAASEALERAEAGA